MRRDGSILLNLQILASVCLCNMASSLKKRFATCSALRHDVSPCLSLSLSLLLPVLGTSWYCVCSWSSWCLCQCCLLLLPFQSCSSVEERMNDRAERNRTRRPPSLSARRTGVRSATSAAMPWDVGVLVREEANTANTADLVGRFDMNYFPHAYRVLFVGQISLGL